MNDKVVVGAHPWVYAAKQPGCDITPILEGIFADMSSAGMEGIELMHTALRPEDAVARIAKLSEEHSLKVIGTSFGGAMWDRDQHQAVLEDAELVVKRLSELGGRTQLIAVALKTGDQDFEGLEQQAAKELEKAGFRPDYFHIRRAADLGEPQADDSRLVLVAAAYLGKARLIDNLELSLDQ